MCFSFSKHSIIFWMGDICLFWLFSLVLCSLFSLGSSFRCQPTKFYLFRNFMMKLRTKDGNTTPNTNTNTISLIQMKSMENYPMPIKTEMWYKISWFWVQANQSKLNVFLAILGSSANIFDCFFAFCAWILSKNRNKHKFFNDKWKRIFPESKFNELTIHISLLLASRSLCPRCSLLPRSVAYFSVDDKLTLCFLCCCCNWYDWEWQRRHSYFVFCVR